MSKNTPGQQEPAAESQSTGVAWVSQKPEQNSSKQAESNQGIAWLSKTEDRDSADNDDYKPTKVNNYVQDEEEELPAK